MTRPKLPNKIQLLEKPSKIRKDVLVKEYNTLANAYTLLHKSAYTSITKLTKQVKATGDDALTVIKEIEDNLNTALEKKEELEKAILEYEAMLTVVESSNKALINENEAYKLQISKLEQKLLNAEAKIPSTTPFKTFIENVKKSIKSLVNKVAMWFKK